MYVRLAVLVSVATAAAAVGLWSACFHAAVLERLPLCANFFASPL